MAISIISDTVQGNSIRVDKNGWHATRRVVIKDCTSTDPSNLIYTAMNDSAVVAIGMYRTLQHPTLTALYCESVHGESLDNDPTTIHLIGEYCGQSADKKPDSTQKPILNISTINSSIETNLDRDGNPIEVTWDGETQGGTVNKNVAIVGITLSRVEPRSTCSPISLNLTYADTINDSSVTIDGVTIPEGTLYCAGVDARLLDDANNFLMTYQFQYNKNGWSATTAFQDQDNKIPSGVSDGDGITTSDLYLAEDFSALHLNGV